MRRGAEVHVLGLRAKVSPQAIIDVPLEEVPLRMRHVRALFELCPRPRESTGVRCLADSKRDHNRVNYDAPFTCYKCGKRYTWTDSLTRHLREGCGKLPRHNCTLCGRKFKRRDYLLRHENNVHKLE